MSLVTLRPGLTLEAEAAASWARMEAAHGGPLDVNRSTVDRGTQQGLYRAYLDYKAGRGPWAPLALTPDASWHCEPRARAVDTDDHAWVRARPGYGWRFVVASEAWHAQYYPEMDNYRGQGFPAGLEDDVLNAATDYDAFAQMLTRFLIFEGRPKGLGASYENGPTFHERLSALAAADARQEAQLAALTAALTELGQGGITPDGLARIADAARDGAEAAVDARYRAQIAGLEAQLTALQNAS